MSGAPRDVPAPSPGAGVVLVLGPRVVATPARLRRTCARVAADVAGGTRVVAVVGAMGDASGRLLGLVPALTPRPSARELDVLVANGGRVSAALLTMGLRALGVPAVSLTGEQAGLVTDAQHRVARVREVRPARAAEALERGMVAVVAGGQGATEAGDVTTLGRGGGGVTAVWLAAALGIGACHVLDDAEAAEAVWFDPVLVDLARRHRIDVRVHSGPARGRERARPAPPATTRRAS